MKNNGLFWLLMTTMLVGTASAKAESTTGSYLSGRFAQSHGEVDNAVEQLKEVHAKKPTDAAVMLQLEGLLLLGGEVDDAMDMAGEIEDAGIDDPLADLVVTLAEIDDGDHDEAAQFLAELREDGSAQLWLPLLAAWVDIARGKMAQPITMKSLGVNAGHTASLVYYHLGLINNQAGFKDEAAKDFKAAIEGQGSNVPPRIMQAVLKFYDKNDTPEMLTPMVQAYLKAHPSQESNVHGPSIAGVRDGVAEVLYTMGGIMYATGMVNDAAIYLQLAAYMKPDMEEAQIALGDAYTELKQYDRAQRYYAMVASSSPYYLKAQFGQVLSDDRKGNLDAALARLDTMRKASPDQSDIWVTKGDLLRMHERYAEAVEAYNEALTMAGGKGVERWAILFARASCLDRQGKWAEAEKDLTAALALKPDEPEVLNYLGFSRLEHGGNVREAKAMIEKAVKVRPNDPQIIDSMGWALYLEGKYQESAKFLEKALEMLPGDAEVNDHVGDLYWRLGRKTEARFQWERSLSFSPEEKLTTNIRKKLKDGLPPATPLSSGA